MSNPADQVEGSNESNMSKDIKTRKPPEKTSDCSSSLSSNDILELVKTYPCLAKYHPSVPNEHERVHCPPSGKVALYKAYLTSSALRLPLTPFYIKVLAYYKVGIAQLHPFAAGKIIRFEMLLKALGQPLSLYMFKKLFLLARTTGDCFTFLYRDKKFRLIDTPSKLFACGQWRFDYFFVDASFIPNEVREILCFGKEGHNSATVAKLNKKVDEEMIDKEHYKILQDNCISYQTYPTRLEGLLVMAGISRDWDWVKIPILKRKSTGQPLSLMDGLKLDFSELDIDAVSNNEGMGLRQHVNEIVPLRPEEDTFDSSFDAFEDPTQPSFDALTAANHMDASSDPFSSHKDFSSPLPVKDAEDRGAKVQEGGEVISIEENDGGASLGDKRRGERLADSSRKYQRVSSSTSPLSAFVRYAGIPAVGFKHGTPERSSYFISPVMDPTTSIPAATSSIASQLPPTNSSSAKMPGTNILSSDGCLEPMPQDASFMNDVSRERVALESSQSVQTRTQAPFMSMRAGSAPVPNLISDFNKKSGSHVYVPRAVDPAQARDLDAMTPPLTLDSNHMTLDELIDRHDLHSFQAVVSGAHLRAHTKSVVRDLHEIISGLQEEKKTIVAECSSLKGNLEAVSKEKEELGLRVSRLSDEIRLKDIDLREKEKELLQSRSSLQHEIDGLRAELSREKQFKEDLVGRVDRGDAFLAAFPDLFRRLLEHPDFRRTFDAFSNAALNAGELRSSLSIKRFLRKNPTAEVPVHHSDALEKLKVADEAWKAKVFPIVDEVPSLARTLNVQELLAYISSPPTSAPASTSASSSETPLSH